MVSNTIPPPSKITSQPLEPGETLLEALKNYHVIKLETDNNYNEKLTWCLEHCQNKFRDISHFRGRSWYFQNEHDASLFALKWT